MTLIKKTKQIKYQQEQIMSKKRKINRSTLYSFDGPFQLVLADVANLEFLGKSATVPSYALLAVDLYLSKAYVYPMQSRKWVLQKLN